MNAKTDSKTDQTDNTKIRKPETPFHEILLPGKECTPFPYYYYSSSFTKCPSLQHGQYSLPLA